MVESQEIKASLGLPQVNQRGLGRGQGKAQPAQDLRQRRECLPGPFPGGAQDNKIVRLCRGPDYADPVWKLPVQGARWVPVVGIILRVRW